MQNWEQNPYVRKHIHRWKLTATRPPELWLPPWMSSLQLTPRAYTELERECQDCGVKQVAECRNTATLVKGYEAIADLDWKAEEKHGP